MATKSTYVDVNKEKYMKALFLDLQKQSKLVDYQNNADIIHNFVINNPTNDSSPVGNHGLLTDNGRIVIKARRKSAKK